MALAGPGGAVTWLTIALDETMAAEYHIFMQKSAAGQ